MRFGVLVLPEFRWPRAGTLWGHMEQLGFDHVWTYDHLAWQTLRDADWFGAVPTLAAAAVTTTRIRLGTLVASPNFRHPVPFARELVTLDDLSQGRITLGIGAGGTGWDAVMLGQEPWTTAERAARFAEFLELLDLVLRVPDASFEGRYYSAVEARTYPGCVQRPRIPFAVAATGPWGMRLAALYGDTWVTYGDLTRRGGVLDTTRGVAVVGDQMRRLDDVCAELGREPTSLARLVLTGPRVEDPIGSEAEFDDAAGRYAEAGVTDLVVHLPRLTEPYRGDRDVFERIFSDMHARRRAVA